MFNVLLTAAGSPVFIPTCKSLRSNPNLKDLRIHTCDMNPSALGLKIADSFFYVPSGNSPEYISTVYSYCKENEIDLIIPAADEELFPLSQNEEMFRNIGCKILVSSSSALNDVQDKATLYSLCRNSFLLKDIVPEFRVCNDLFNFKRAHAEIREFDYQVCIKPAFGHGSRGFRVIEGMVSKEAFFKKKPNPRSITYESFCGILGQDDELIPDLLVMEYLPGEEFSVDCFAKDGEFYCITRRRDTIKEGICASGAAIEKPDLIRLAKTLYQKLNLKYSVNIQFRYDKFGNPKLLEINPRIAGTMELSRGAGVDFIRLAVDQALGFKNTLKFSPRWETKMDRVWLEIFHRDNSLFTLEDISSVMIDKFYESTKFTEEGKQKTALVDIDETICFYSKTRKYDSAEPNYDNIAKINKLYEEGWKIIYWTGRGSVSGKDYTEFTKSQLNKWGCKYHDLITGTTPISKPHFDLVIDDKSKRVEEL